MPSGTYTEQLPCGGKLTVTATTSSIEYYFPGPDLRYSGTLLSIPASRVSAYIEAFEANWQEFERLKGLTPAGGTFEKPAAAGMTIRVGGHWPGVSIKDYHMAMSTRPQIDRVIEAYRYTTGRAAEIQRLLQSLG